MAEARGNRSRLLIVLGGIVGLIGVGLALAGVWLAVLGGSWYYLVAGSALIATAVLLTRRNPAALWIYAALLICTMAWALWEVGFDFWSLAPRGDVLAVLGIVLALPWVVRRLGSERWPGPAWPLVAGLVLAGVVALGAAINRPHDLQGELPGARGQASAALYAGVPQQDWTAYGRSWRGDRWSPVNQITPTNAGKLEKAWEFHTGDLQRESDPDEFTYEVTPIKVGGLVYLCSPHNIVFALDAETGREVWRYNPNIRASKQMQHLTCRGVSYHSAAQSGSARSAGGDCPDRIIMGTNDARLIALDAKTGRPCPSFGNKGEVDVWPNAPAYQRGWWQITSPPVIVRNLAVIGGAVYDNKSNFMPSGVIRAYDVTTGRQVWGFDPGNPGDTSPKAPGVGRYVPSSPNSWTISAADEQLGLVYVPTGMAAIDQWGGRRTPETERFSAAILALDAATGQLRWSFQTVHHDLWDMDVPAQPALVDLDLPGRGRVPALVQSTKTGNIFVLDRRTGKPLFPVSERPVPGNAAPGDRLSPTQPFSAVSMMPTKRVTGADMWGATMFDQLACRIKFAGLRYDGPFTPPSTQGSLVFPGNFGVMDWGGMAIDPVRQIAFAHPNYMAFVDRLIPREPTSARYDPSVGPQESPNTDQGPAGGSDFKGSDTKGYNPNYGAPFAVALNPFLSPLGLPCQSPPWGYVAGLDLTTGKVVWQHRNGTSRDQTPIPLPFKLGVPSLGGPIVTAGGVAFMGSALDYYLRAYDVTTGDVLWRGRLPAGGQATPMSYWSNASGRQFVVIAAGGHGSLGTKQGDSIVAFALPKGS
ncbi:membrane-bound PQQ-dependent dehydrogenase, glucose/quinate/shikimate family [Sphingomonas solaris]|uniref:Membrane-bound PQQ-dependent dehydrogenase, glucose/quinate/shikimate family n=1 Tax=Alterirhizorhabdus solaris TaxID=2529389 RepID=A0A558RCX6_9SPHN|nr:membrane-bound PQQ-dependent dehydrogenase, glucose/quinate/shikimate family [Sphingomonas solaris]TVV77337.1 membrane-bound PQQ-dependent dehydrogenase, glucose/quinate/shikimate family [Sphingomonas solaris]